MKHPCNILYTNKHVYLGVPDKSGTLVNKFNREIGYQITKSIDYSNVKTYILQQCVTVEDNPDNVIPITDLQLEIILDYVSVMV